VTYRDADGERNGSALGRLWRRNLQWWLAGCLLLLIEGVSSHGGVCGGNEIEVKKPIKHIEKPICFVWLYRDNHAGVLVLEGMGGEVANCPHSVNIVRQV